MGYERRLIRAVLALAVSSSAAACSKPEPDKRQQLLAAEERDRSRRERAASKRAISPEGDLLPSDTKLGGIVMPRGYEPKFVDEHEWTYDADIPLDKARRYFEQRLTTTKIEETPRGEIVFSGAREKSEPNMPAAVVKVMRVPARPTGSRIYVAEPIPVTKLTPIEEDDDVMRLRLAEERRIAR